MNEFEDFSNTLEKHLQDLQAGGDGFEEELNLKASNLQAAIYSISARVTEKETTDEDRHRTKSN